MTWQPIPETSLWDLINQAEARMTPDLLNFWEAVRILPDKWSQPEYGKEGGGFWVVGIVGTRVIWFNDIEDGFNVSRWKSAGVIDEYWCDQLDLELVLEQLRYLVETGSAMSGRAGPPKSGEYPDA